ncbi:hypothetical protein C7I87_05280 [Mesorhizobium sp. SARCC-RB16n]|nr:hypothetical protein C7I87_05280 [Mesorhizobium sp. SARCC-RB16n]
MKKYVAAVLTIGITIGPASALDASIGGNSGGIGIGGGLNVGSKGASVGVGASVGGVDGANVGASVGAGNGTIDGGVSAGANVGDTSGGVSTGIGVGDDPAAGNESTTAPGNATAVTTATPSAKTAKQSIVLPPALMPPRAGGDGSAQATKGYPFGSLAPLKGKPGTPAAVVRACRAAIMSAATPLGAIRVNAASAGTLRQRRGALTAPIEVRIDYTREGGIEVRQARVGCRLDAAGRVTAII